MSEDDGHFTTHDYSREVVSEYLDAKCSTLEEKWAMLTRLFKVPLSMKGIQDKTYDPFLFDMHD